MSVQYTQLYEIARVRKAYRNSVMQISTFLILTSIFLKLEVVWNILQEWKDQPKFLIDKLDDYSVHQMPQV